ncbi:aminodeoxychorismate synthase component I [Paracoccus sulfuroxidans]|uniref:Aminodeoxychorismate synthase, subunit I n=1 Tax=Paracoccus sulfuroxidans TaxID=384678 RepID=A0A562NUL7_9RHOB|nr:aminodeoxychorismate synthase component I [Paracoccus sulfuroxidans]TWI35855.1 aminodeoxychorismate synthase, subunit I [Paracoccus sulfuroxidans]
MIFCEFGPLGEPVRFGTPRALVTAERVEEVLPALARLEQARRDGAWVAGVIAYEAGFAFEPRLAPLTPRMDQPLLAFGIYDSPPEPAQMPPPGKAALEPIRPLISKDDYQAAFARTQDYIAAGDCYQINLTFPLETRLTEGTPLELYGALAARQPVGFGAFVDLGVGPVIVSRSPELFVRLDAHGAIETRPMKGTAPRDPDPKRDAELAAALSRSEKDRAENLMIVDLLRNDIARISTVGSVRVPELFAVDSFATVHQMSSRVVGQLAEPANLPDLMRALFPCGSITGAPKIRAMQIIHEVEPFARGIYCGSIGWMAPDGAAAFSVAIRTLAIWDDGRVRLNVGGGVVQDSTAAGEWEEALWKARYVQDLTTPL